MDLLYFNVFLSNFKDKKNVIHASINRMQCTLLSSLIFVQNISLYSEKIYHSKVHSNGLKKFGVIAYICWQMI